MAKPELKAIIPPSLSCFSPDLAAIEKILSAAMPHENPHDPSESSLAVFPGFCDVHVHFREPGFSYKETMRSGSIAAARGGFTDVCTMPNLDPVPDSLAHLALEEAIIERDAAIRVYPYASITCDEAGQKLADIAALGERVVGFSDDGKGVQSEETMREAMEQIARTGKPICTHSEIEEIKGAGYINDGAYARKHGHIGVPKEAEWRQIERDIRLCRETGVAYHVCHISCIESIELIRKAKAEGVNVTCETAPHYLVVDDSMLEEDGRFKMNPPLRSPEDRAALIEALRDGTIDMIATDHAPHSAQEKAQGLAGSAFGVVGIETSFQLMYTEFVRTGIISMDRLMDLMVTQPRKRFGLPMPSSCDVTVWDLGWHGVIDPAEFVSLGKAQPFTGREIYGRCLLTLCDGKIAYVAPELAQELAQAGWSSVGDGEAGSGGAQ